MRFLACLVLAAAAACGSSSLTDPNQPGTGGAAALPATDADCRIFNPTACRLDLAKTAVGIDVNYPNVVFCRLQLLPTRDQLDNAALADALQVSIAKNGGGQIALTAELPVGVLEYPLGPEQLYLSRVTFASKSSDTIATLVANTLGPDVSLYAIPLECPGRRP